MELLSINGWVRSRSQNHYTILQSVGSGGNSIVYLALCKTQRYRGVIFALKLFTNLGKKDRIEKFYHEIDFLRNQCNHPSIMRLFDEGQYSVEIDGNETTYPFVIAEYLPDTLKDALNKQFDMVDKVSTCIQLLSALCYLDSEKVIHRDIKPQNIFIKGKSCVIGDFGLMKFLQNEVESDREHYVEGTSHGMPFYYRTPDLVEYANGKTELTTKSDIFQLGLVFAEIFTGKNPLRPAKKITDTIVLKEVDEINGKQGKQIRSIIQSMLELDPINRPSAHDIFDTWDGVFREIIEMSIQLNGKVFL